ncbi:slr1658 superfamily regulator [Pararhizobium sp.]|uniref:slr1658 superfamily regulator n=1 Tax=Pararhizobium sp. TaxID=1977563 RepID=UPI003D0B5071
MQQSFGTIELRNSTSASNNFIRLVDGTIGLGWHHCAATSDFLGEFFALQRMPNSDQYIEVRHSIGYLVNELLENAVKFRQPGDIVIESSLEGGRFEIRVANRVSADVAERFQKTLEDMTSRDPGELLIERLEANAADSSSTSSGLGILTLMNDYEAEMRWVFRLADDGTGVELETAAALNLF